MFLSSYVVQNPDCFCPNHSIFLTPKPSIMRKQLTIFIICALIFFVSLQCSKSKADKQADIPIQNANMVDYSAHKVSRGEADRMIARFDEQINPIILDQFKNGNPGYEPTRMVTYNIDQLSAFLQDLQTRGSTKVHVRFAAIAGDGTNGSISGLPYQTVLFYGNKLSVSGREEDEFFDHGELCPQSCPTDSSSARIQPGEQLPAASGVDYDAHKVSRAEANNMMTRFDDRIKAAVSGRFRNDNAGYEPTRMVTYNIDQLNAFLQTIREKGATKVHVRFAAIEGDGVNGLIKGMPYQTILFYGNNKSFASKEDSTGDGGFDHGQLCPSICD